MRVLFAAVSMLGLAATAGAAGSWLEGKAARNALRPWKICSSVRELVEHAQDVRARAIVGGVEVNAYHAGSGREAYAIDTVMRLGKGCDGRGYSIEGGKESMIGGMKAIAFGAATAPTPPELAGLAAVLEVTRPDVPELAAARMLVQLAAGESGDGSPAPAVGQPEHEGKPRGSPAAVWSAAALRAAGVHDPNLADEEGAPFDAIHTVRVRDPVLLAKHGTWQVWELRFQARLGGGLLAVYDAKADRHRWVYVTELDNGGAHFEVPRFDDDVVVVRTKFDGSVELTTIELATGVVRGVRAVEEE